MNKPAGLVVHPGAGHGAAARSSTRCSATCATSPASAESSAPGIVHRLDRGTSGLLVVAKDDETHRSLVRQFAGRTVEKEYLALVTGRLPAPSGEIDAPIGRDPVHRQRMSVRAPRGREARTSWRGRGALRRGRASARAHPHRPHAPDPRAPRLDRPPRGGRRHLRRHAHAFFAPRGGPRGPASLERPALHAARLAFTHPASGERCPSRRRSPPISRRSSSACAPPRAPSALLSSGRHERRRRRRPLASCTTGASTPGRSSTSTWTRSSEPGGVRGPREVVRQRGSVAALPVLDDGRVVLVRQYRYAVDARVWELPAGRRDPGETPEEGARRELEEEVGLRAGALEPLLIFWTTPGFCDEVMHLFRATAPRAGPARPEADERIEQATFTLDEAMAMMRRGEIREGKTLVALLLERRRRTEPTRTRREARCFTGRNGLARTETEPDSAGARTTDTEEVGPSPAASAPPGPAGASVVVLEPEVRDQLLAAQVAQRVLQLHQLDEEVVLRVEARAPSAGS